MVSKQPAEGGAAANKPHRGKGRGFHFWLRRFFVVWAILSTAWFVNLFRTRGVPDEVLADDDRVMVEHTDETLSFLPRNGSAPSGLVFIVGGGVAAESYALLLRPVAARGYPVHIVRLPYRLAPLEAHKRTAVQRARNVIAAGRDVERWVLAGHSLGGALASRLAADPPANLAAVVLIGTSHPKELDLSDTRLAVTKVFATQDGIATPAMIDATRGLLPDDTRWVEIEGGNHSQFGHYGHQLFDGTPTITRQRQQQLTREELLRALAAREVGGPDPLSGPATPFTDYPDDDGLAPGGLKLNGTEIGVQVRATCVAARHMGTADGRSLHGGEKRGHADTMDTGYSVVSSGYVVGWGTLALINAGIAQGKNRSGLGWFLLSLLLGPVATFILVVLPSQPPEAQ